MLLLLDNSAWSRRRIPEVRGRFASVLRAERLAVCLPFLLEAGYSARSASDHDTVLADLATLPHVAITPEVERQALEAQAALARVGHHRLSPVDVMIAACAHEAGAGVLHYDHDYDLLRQRTRLRFRSEWLAPPGTLA
jgi:predicted nucleic acid-binding protein